MAHPLVIKAMKKHPDRWIALSKDEKQVMAVDKSYLKAIDKAKKKGEKNPVLIQSQSSAGNF